MTTWLERREKVLAHSAFVEWREAGHGHLAPSEPRAPLHMHVKMTKYSSASASFDELNNNFGARDFEDALADFVVLHNNPLLPAATRRNIANELRIPTRKVPVYYVIKFWNHNASTIQHDDARDERDAVHVRPARQDHRGRTVPGRFDTVLVDVASSGDRGIVGAYLVCELGGVGLNAR